MTFMWVMFALAGLFAVVAGVAFLRVVGAAFRSSRREGLLCLLVPGYVLYFAFLRLSHPKKVFLLGAWLGSAALAGLCVQLSTAWAPQPAVEAEAAFDDLEGFEDLGDFEDLDDFDDLDDSETDL